MTTRQPKVQTQLGRAAVQIFAANDRMNQILIEHLDPAAWRAKPPGKVRTIAAIFTHMHNVRCKWVRLTAPHLKVPRQLNRAHCTPQQARAGLAESAARCAEMLAEALGGGGGRVEKFHRDGWAPALAGWSGNAVLHAYSRSPPSRAGVHARASARIPVAQRGGVRDVELGKDLERVRDELATPGQSRGGVEKSKDPPRQKKAGWGTHFRIVACSKSRRVGHPCRAALPFIGRTRFCPSQANANMGREDLRGYGGGHCGYCRSGIGDSRGPCDIDCWCRDRRDPLEFS